MGVRVLFPPYPELVGAKGLAPLRSYSRILPPPPPSINKFLFLSHLPPNCRTLILSIIENWTSGRRQQGYYILLGYFPHNFLLLQKL